MGNAFDDDLEPIVALSKTFKVTSRHEGFANGISVLSDRDLAQMHYAGSLLTRGHGQDAVTVVHERLSFLESHLHVHNSTVLGKDLADVFRGQMAGNTSHKNAFRVRMICH